MAEDLPTFVDVVQNRILVVPDYQRPYAWEARNLAELWEDLDLLGADRHYAGTLILQRTEVVERTRSGQELTAFELVDGQQRLTTCFILLEQVRRRLKNFAQTWPEAAEAVSDLDRLLRVHIAGVNRPRLRLAEDLNDIFARSIMNADLPDQRNLIGGAQRLLDAAQFYEHRLLDLVSGAGEDEAIRRLLEVRARVCFQLRFLVYSVESSAEVGVLFETVNGRGQELSELELVKNYLLYLARQLPDDRCEELARQINGAWSDIFSAMSAVKLGDDALLRAHWFATVNANSREWRGSGSVKSRFSRSRYVHSSGRFRGDVDSDESDEDVLDALFSDVSEYVESLRRCSTYFRDLFDSSLEYRYPPKIAAEARRLSDGLVAAGTTANFWPLLVATRLKYPHDGELFCRVLDLSERFSARVYAICAARPNAGRSTLGYLARDLYSGVDPQDVLLRISEKLWQLAPDSQVSANFAEGIRWYARRSHKYLLYQYELSAVRDAGDLPTFNYFSSVGQASTEHVLPQNPGEASRWRDDFSDHELRELTHDIGNLVLTRDNSSYGRKEYSEKRGHLGQESPPCYQSRIALVREREIATKYESWTPHSIAARRREIEEWALRRWRVEEPRDELEVDLDDNDDEYGDENSADRL